MVFVHGNYVDLKYYIPKSGIVRAWEIYTGLPFETDSVKNSNYDDHHMHFDFCPNPCFDKEFGRRLDKKSGCQDVVLALRSEWSHYPDYCLSMRANFGPNVDIGGGSVRLAIGELPYTPLVECC